jgi:chemotaxis protein MotB
VSKKQKAHNHDDEHIDETWLIPYADLLTLLLALFIVLFASSSIDAKKFDQIMVSFSSVLSGGTGVLDQSMTTPITKEAAERAKAEETEKQQQSPDLEERIKKETKELEKLKKQLDEYIEKNGLTSQLETKLNQQQLMITISDNALFASGSAQVKPEARKLAVAISDMLEKYPQYEINVSGHTDDRAINTLEFQSNWDLSSKRALNFMMILLMNEELNPARFSAIGYGEFRPIASNATAEGRSINRRVEVSIIRNFKSNTEVIVVE